MDAVKTAIKAGDVTVAKNKYVADLLSDPDKAKAFLRRVMGPPRRQVTGDEYDHMMTVFKLTEPDRYSNNQRTETDEYLICGKEYHVTYGIEDKPIIEEILNEPSGPSQTP